MFILSNFLHAITYITDLALTFYMWAIIISALLSWVNPDPYNPIVRFLHSITEPVLYPIRRRLGSLSGIDISPMIVIIIIIFVKRFLITSLFEMAMKLKG
ncbi:MAG: YggT family protein [Nitrospirae bacterium]|nr:YggT family protein [Nitrospirota bacterium]